MQASVTLKDVCNIGACAPGSFVLEKGWLEKLHPLHVLLPLEIDLAKSSSPAIKKEAVHNLQREGCPEIENFNLVIVLCFQYL